MSRKTTSEQDNRVSLLNELKKEFSVYIEIFFQKRNLFLKKYPRQLFAAMVVAMLLSGVLAFTIMRVPKVGLPSLTPVSSSLTGGLGELVQTGHALKEVLALQQQINTVLQKDSLNASDSLLVKKAIIRLEAIHAETNNSIK